MFSAMVIKIKTEFSKEVDHKVFLEVEREKTIKNFNR